MKSEYKSPYTVPVSPPEPTATGSVAMNEKNMAMFAHLSVFLGCIIPTANVVAPLIIWQLKKETMPYAAAHAKEALNFQVSLLILMAICGLLCLVFVGFIGLIALGVLSLVCTIFAAIKANDGHSYRYPMTIRLIK